MLAPAVLALPALAVYYPAVAEPVPDTAMKKLSAKKMRELEEMLAEDIKHWKKPDPEVARRILGRPPRFRGGHIHFGERPGSKFDAPGGPQGDTGIPEEDED